MIARTRRWAAVAALALLAGGVLVGQEVENSPPLELRSTDPLALDLALPALETYRDWPPDELVERLFGAPWSEMTFRRAAMFGRPVLFLLTVDWNFAAQKMTQTTLSSPEVLRAINASYITVVVNADLRPDLAERYTTGAWPVIAFLLPDGMPLLSQANDMGLAQPITTTLADEETMLFLLEQGALYWSRNSALLRRMGAQWGSTEGPAEPLPGAVNTGSSDGVERWLMGNADRLEGGFGVAPKFLVRTLEEYGAVRAARGNTALHRHSRLTLEKLVASPLFDRREGGLHRAAAGASFTEIQYEKMLEVNASFVRQLVRSLRSSDSEELRQALSRTVGFLRTVLARTEGGFYLAQSADGNSEDGGGFWVDPTSYPQAPPVNRLLLVGPNARAGAALLRAGIFLGDDEVIRAGRQALDLVLDQGCQAGRGCFHVLEPFRDPRVYLVAQADTALALADAFETTGDARYLAASRDIVDFVRANLKQEGGFVFLDRLRESRPTGLLANPRTPLRPNVRMARAMIRLSWHNQGQHYRDEAVRLLSTYSGDLSAYRVHGVEAALAIEEAVGDPLRVRIRGRADDPMVERLRRTAVNHAAAWVVVLAGEADGRALAEVAWKGRTTDAKSPEELVRAITELSTEDGS